MKPRACVSRRAGPSSSSMSTIDGSARCQISPVASSRRPISSKILFPNAPPCSVQMDLHPLINQRLQLVRFLAEEPTEGLRR